jgi:hypothetical protein
MFLKRDLLIAPCAEAVLILVLAVLLTTFITLAIRASQPAALATALLVSLGSMQSGRDAVAIIVSVILAAIGEPLRRWRAATGRKHELARQ